MAMKHEKVTFQLAPWLLRKIKAEAKRTHTTVSGVVRTAIMKYLEPPKC